MSELVVNGADLVCPMGKPGKAKLIVPPAPKVVSSKLPMATIMDSVPMTNIPSFGMCTTLTNPQVAAATSAALGTLTPQPCTPVVTLPWAPGAPTVMIGGKPALTKDSSCMCLWGGKISITGPGQDKTKTG